MSDMKIENEKLKPIIDDILGYYFNQKTRMQYKASIQKDMVGQNRGLRNACSSVISFATDEDALVEYTKAKIEEINQGEAQEVDFR